MADGKITGTLKYVSTGQLASAWGAGNFMALDFSGIDTEGLTSLKVGMVPSQGSGLVEVLGDPDMNGAFKVTDKDTQVFRVTAAGEGRSASVDYDLSGLVCEAS